MAGFPRAALSFELGSSLLCRTSTCRSLFIRHPLCSAPKAAGRSRRMQRVDGLGGSSRPGGKKKMKTTPFRFWTGILAKEGPDRKSQALCREVRNLESQKIYRGRPTTIKALTRSDFPIPEFDKRQKIPARNWASTEIIPSSLEKAKSRTPSRSASSCAVMRLGYSPGAELQRRKADQFSFVSALGGSLVGSLLVIALPRNRSSAAMSCVSFVGSVAT